MIHEVTTYPTGAIGQYVGIQDIKKPTVPGAGVEWTFTLPAGYFYRLLSGTATFVTSAAVANRNVGIKVTDGTNLLYQLVNTNAIAASNTAVVCYNQGTAGGGVLTANGAFAIQFALGWLPPGYVLSSVTQAKDVADQYSAIVLWFDCLDFGTQGMPMLSHPPTHEELHEVQPALLESFR